MFVWTCCGKGAWAWSSNSAGWQACASVMTNMPCWVRLLCIQATQITVQIVCHTDAPVGCFSCVREQKTRNNCHAAALSNSTPVSHNTVRPKHTHTQSTSACSTHTYLLAHTRTLDTHRQGTGRQAHHAQPPHGDFRFIQALQQAGGSTLQPPMWCL